MRPLWSTGETVGGKPRPYEDLLGLEERLFRRPETRPALFRLNDD